MDTANPNALWSFIFSAVVAFATALYMLFSCLLWWTTKKNTDLTRAIFQATHRPYVGVTDIQVAQNQQIQDLKIRAEIKNVGTVPSHETETRWGVHVDGVPVPGPKDGEMVSILPQCSTFLNAVIGVPYCASIRAGASKLELAIQIHYKGVDDEQYDSSVKCEYEHVIGRFLIIYSKGT